MRQIIRYANSFGKFSAEGESAKYALTRRMKVSVVRLRAKDSVFISTCSSRCFALEIKGGTGEMRVSQPKKHKAACDQCNASKVKCPGGSLPCQRCADSSQPCHYSLARRIGKPPGSKNRKTLERLRQAKEGNLENNNGEGEGGDSSIPQNTSSRNDSDEALGGGSERREGEDSQDLLPMSNTTNFWPLSPLSNYPTLLDASQLLPITEQDLLAGDHSVSFDGGEIAVFDPADPKFPGVGRVESRMPWADAPDDFWNVSILPYCVPTLTN